MNDAMTMTGLPFKLPDFARTAWVSDNARAIWQPVLQAIGTAWREVEWRSVVRGVRGACVVVLQPSEYLEFAERVIGEGLTVLPLQMQGVGGYGYASTSVEPRAGRPFVFRAVVAAPRDAAQFARAYSAADDAAMGGLLGYPECCRVAFVKDWVDGQSVDPTWQAAQRTTGGRRDGQKMCVGGSTESNILLRWLGVRAVPHLPCSFDCPATVVFGQRLRAVGIECGHGDAMNAAYDMLEWPARWSALHGIAEIKTPIVKISTRADATATEYVVERPGLAYPSGGATGLRFPYVRGEVLTKAVAPPVPSVSTGRSISEARPWLASDNGFSSAYAMDEAHAPIVSLVAQLEVARECRILDIGCGNGWLLRRVLDQKPAWIPWGIDLDIDRIRHAREIHPQHAANFRQGNVAHENEWERGMRYDVTLLMPGRLLEMSIEDGGRLRQRLLDGCGTIVAYAYGDWLQRYGGLRALCLAAGLEVGGPVVESGDRRSAAALGVVRAGSVG